MATSDHLQHMREVFHESPFLAHLGIQLGELGPGTAELLLEVRPEFTNRQGTAHGGVLATLMDSALSQAIRTLVPPETRSATVEMKLNYLAPGAPGRLVARGRAIQVGGSLAIAQAEIYDSRDTLVAVGLGTFRLFRSQSRANE